MEGAVCIRHGSSVAWQGRHTVEPFTSPTQITCLYAFGYESYFVCGRGDVVVECGLLGVSCRIIFQRHRHDYKVLNGGRTRGGGL